MEEEKSKSIKQELQKIIKKNKLLCLKSILGSSKWKAIQFLERIIDDFCKTLIFLIDCERQSEIASFIEDNNSNLDYWITSYNEKSDFPKEYNGLYYYFISKASALVGFPSAYANKATWTETEVIEFYKKCGNKNQPKETLKAEDFLQHLSGQSIGGELAQSIEKVVVECIQLYKSGTLKQRKFDAICQKFERKYEEEIFALDSEDKEQLSFTFDKLAEALHLKKQTL